VALSCAILVSLCRLETGREGGSAEAGQPYGSMGALPPITQARTNPAAGFWAGGAWVSLADGGERREGGLLQTVQLRADTGWSLV
jgi:hypothetical protein